MGWAGSTCFRWRRHPGAALHVSPQVLPLQPIIDVNCIMFATQSEIEQCKVALRLAILWLASLQIISKLNPDQGQNSSVNKKVQKLL